MSNPTDATFVTVLTTAVTEVTVRWANGSQNESLENIGTCNRDLLNGEFPLVLISTLAVNLLALVVLLRMRGTCDSLDHSLVSLLNANDLITTGLFTLMWTIGWASCNRLLMIPAFCSVFGLLASTLLVWSSAIILVISSFRLLSLAKPLYYRANVTSRTVTRTAVGSLVFSLLLFVFPFTGAVEPFVLYEDYHMCVVQLTPGEAGVGQRVFIGLIGSLGCATVVYVVVSNLAIVRTLRRRHVIRPQVSSVSAGPDVHRVMSKRRIFGHVTLAVSFVFTLCYAPFVVRLIVDCIYNVRQEDVDDIGHHLSRILLFLNPLLNPVVYGVFNKQFRVTLVALLKVPIRVDRNKVRPNVIVRDT